LFVWPSARPSASMWVRAYKNTILIKEIMINCVLVQEKTLYFKFIPEVKNLRMDSWQWPRCQIVPKYT
jgi:hypothetical protein